MSLTKFYHYSMWIEDGVRKRVEPSKATDSSIFNPGLELVSKSDGKGYHMDFQELDEETHHGVIVRAKDEDRFIRLTNSGGMGPLSEATRGDGLAGDMDMDYVDFVIRENSDGYDLLVEQGFQTPGIGIVSEYIENHMNSTDCDIGHKTKMVEEDVERIKDLLEKDLKKVEVSFKKRPEISADESTEETLKSLIPDDYRLEFGVSLEPGKGKETTKAKQLFNTILSTFGGNHDTVEDTIEMIDFPKIMHTFRVVGLDGEQEVEENLADIISKEKINTDDFDIFDKRLGRELASRL